MPLTPMGVPRDIRRIELALEQLLAIFKTPVGNFEVTKLYVTKKQELPRLFVEYENTKKED